MAAPQILPATAERWRDVVAVFEDCTDGKRCWCAYWYLPNREFKAGWGEANRATLEKLVLTGVEPGILAYVDGEPAAWLLVAPRTQFDRLNRSKPLAAVDEQAVWAMACFIVRKKYCRYGLTRALILGGLDFVRDRGGAIVEAYPVDPGDDPKARLASWDAFVGPIRVFRELGFVEVARRLPRRPILRLSLQKRGADESAPVVRLKVGRGARGWFRSPCAGDFSVSIRVGELAAQRGGAQLAKHFAAALDIDRMECRGHHRGRHRQCCDQNYHRGSPCNFRNSRNRRSSCRCDDPDLILRAKNPS